MSGGTEYSFFESSGEQQRATVSRMMVDEAICCPVHRFES